MKAPFALAIVAAAMLAPALAYAQVKHPVYVHPVYVNCKTENGDEIGKGLCSSLRDAIAKSPRYALLTSPGKELHSVIDIVSVSIAPIAEHSASSVVFGYAVGAGAMSYLTHEVITTGSQKIDQQAAGLLVDLDTLIDDILKAKP